MGRKLFGASRMVGSCAVRRELGWRGAGWELVGYK